MQKSDTYGSREMLKQLPTRQLQLQLQDELNKPEPDSQTVLQLLNELKTRQPDPGTELTPEAEQAWEVYCARTGVRPKKPARKHLVNRWFLRAACIAVSLGLVLGVMTYRVEAEPLWKRLVRWTDSVIEFFGSGSSGSTDPEYEFRTDHPGLQQVYDTVTELGVTQPIVPMWLPEGYELSSCNQEKVSKMSTITAFFANADKKISYNTVIYSESVTNSYQKDNVQIEIVNIAGIEHYITKNMDVWLVVWTVENIECSLSINCQRDELYRVLRSIYTVEVT